MVKRISNRVGDSDFQKTGWFASESLSNSIPAAIPTAMPIALALMIETGGKVPRDRVTASVS